MTSRQGEEPKEGGNDKGAGSDRDNLRNSYPYGFSSLLLSFASSCHSVLSPFALHSLTLSVPFFVRLFARSFRPSSPCLRPVVTPFVTHAHFTSPFGCRYDRVALLTSLLPAARMVRE